jgi:lysophospholipase L1-like esterase
MTLRRRRRLVYILLTVVLALAVVFLFCEALVRLLVPREVFWPIGNIYRPVATPGLGYTFRPDFRGTAFGVDLVTNDLGFRGPAWAAAKPPGVFRIALIGDSNAFGYGVPFEKTVGEVLAGVLAGKRGAPCEVLNFGVPGYNSRQHLVVWRQHAAAYRPDVVIVLLDPNDHHRPLWACREGWLHHGPMPEHRVEDEAVARVAPGPLPALVRHSRLVPFLLHVRKKHRLGREAQRERDPGHAVAPDAGWMGPIAPGPVPAFLREAVYAPLRTLVREARGAGAAVVVASVAYSPGYRRLLRCLAADERVPVLELLSLFPEAKSRKDLAARFGLGWDMHFNAPAHRRWAEALAEKIEP